MLEEHSLIDRKLYENHTLYSSLTCSNSSTHQISKMQWLSHVKTFQPQLIILRDTYPVLRTTLMEELSKLADHTVSPATVLCPACTNPVYTAEAMIAADRTPFHKACVKCRRCRKMLSAATINEHREHLYCKACYHVVFMEKVYQNSRKLFINLEC